VKYFLDLHFHSHTLLRFICIVHYCSMGYWIISLCHCFGSCCFNEL